MTCRWIVFTFQKRQSPGWIRRGRPETVETPSPLVGSDFGAITARIREQFGGGDGETAGEGPIIGYLGRVPYLQQVIG